MGRDGHELKFTWGPLDERLKAALYDFKSQQYRLSGFVDAAAQTRRLRLAFDWSYDRDGLKWQQGLPSGKKIAHMQRTTSKRGCNATQKSVAGGGGRVGACCV